MQVTLAKSSPSFEHNMYVCLAHFKHNVLVTQHPHLVMTIITRAIDVANVAADDDEERLRSSAFVSYATLPTRWSHSES